MNFLIPTTLKQTSVMLAITTIAATLIAWWQIPAPNPQADIADSQVEWQLPNIASQTNVNLINNQLYRLQPWGKTDKKGEQAGTQSEASVWQLVGIVSQGNQDFALLQDGTGKVKRYQVGNELGEAVVLQGIYGDYVEISRDNQIETQYLYK